MTRTREPSVFRWTWDAPRAWAAELRRLSPKQDRLSHLELHWVAGLPDVPMQRWVLFEMVPMFAVLPNELLRAQVNQVMANPWGQAMHAWAAYEILSQQRCPIPFWVLQGPNGGHKYRYTNADREFAMWHGQDGEAPLVGDLPYAEWTPLTARLIRLHSLMTNQRHTSFAAEREARVEAMQRECRRLMLHSITESGIADLAGEAAPILVDTMPSVEKGHGAHGGLNAMSAKYVETGVLDPNE